ncbi:hypothetical protein [Burkholderia multivorans]|uniref:hypothetical protein n=1 Tax=Burkholderia multivorans TaxID=87883 RepID=UPI0013DE96DD|nr:hypothetical protein [Burkholderia multivorans]MBU9261713.1 hypothetical protein [Burkholderia multivorans]MBU9618831.1 hypothetical protein [Burkholderia multivorans]NGM77771.1 hypothetical protein [Burkholderia multivorans]
MEKASVEVRTFSSIEEVRQCIPNFVDDNPLTKTNYKQLVGDYNFTEEVRCCFLKENGRLCGESHKKGWVAELHDGSATIIGNHCAKEKFGADSKFVVDRSRYLNEQRLKRQLSLVRLQIAEQTERLARLAELRTKLHALEDRVAELTSSVGSQTMWSLQSMQRSGRSDVQIKAIKFRESTDKNGKTTQERSFFSHTLGSFRGLDLVQSTSFSNLYRLIKSIEWAYNDAAKLPEKPKSKEVESLASRLNEYDRALREGNQLLQLESDFFENSFLLLCFLSTDKSERFKAAKIAMRQAGVHGSKNDAKAWLAEQEKALKEQLAADAIEIR